MGNSDASLARQYAHPPHKAPNADHSALVRSFAALANRADAFASSWSAPADCHVRRVGRGASSHRQGVGDLRRAPVDASLRRICTTRERPDLAANRSIQSSLSRTTITVLTILRACSCGVECVHLRQGVADRFDERPIFVAPRNKSIDRVGLRACIHVRHSPPNRTHMPRSVRSETHASAATRKGQRGSLPVQVHPARAVEEDCAIDGDSSQHDGGRPEDPAEPAIGVPEPE